MELTIVDFETWKIVLSVCVKYGADCHEGNKIFFDNLLSQYVGDLTAEALTAWLEKQIPTLFSTFGERPRWIQNNDWPFYEDVPMIFVGQIDLDNPPKEKLHDKTSFYLFVPVGQWSDDDIKIVTQQH